MRIDEVRLTPVWVNPKHLVETARIVMAGHKLKVIGVVEGDRFAGVLKEEDLEGRQDSERVVEAVAAPEIVLDSTTRIENAADVFVERDCQYVPVVEGEQFVGIVTSNMLLRELRHSRDPLTGLPWSDQLREWGTEQLKSGHEITIIFIDLDDFGLYNKRYGHIVGDRVLKRFVDCLTDRIDPEKDLLVRFGGDEFVIGTLRNHREVSNLLQRVTTRTSAMEVGEHIDPVGFTIGVAGGRRTIERDNIHYASTLDNLINLASKDCQRRKPNQPVPTEPAPLPISAPVPTQPEPTPEATSSKPDVVSIHDGRKSGGTLTTVILSMGDTVVSGVDNRAESDSAASVARATLAAMERLPGQPKVNLAEVIHEEARDGSRLVTAVGVVSLGADERYLSGTAQVTDDLLVAVAAAAIEIALSARVERP